MKSLYSSLERDEFLKEFEDSGYPEPFLGPQIIGGEAAMTAVMKVCEEMALSAAFSSASGSSGSACMLDLCRSIATHYYPDLMEFPELRFLDDVYEGVKAYVTGVVEGRPKVTP